MMRMPLITDTPNNEMNPIAAEILKFNLKAYSPKMPPLIANGSPSSDKRLLRNELNSP